MAWWPLLFLAHLFLAASGLYTISAAAKSFQCPTLCDPIDSSPPGSTVPGILQARTLEWVAISLSKAWKWKVKVKSLSRAWLLATPWTAAYQAPPSMGFSRQEYWRGVPLPSPSPLLNSLPSSRVLFPLGSCLIVYKALPGPSFLQIPPLVVTCHRLLCLKTLESTRLFAASGPLPEDPRLQILFLFVCLAEGWEKRTSLRGLCRSSSKVRYPVILYQTPSSFLPLWLCK